MIDSVWQNTQGGASDTWFSIDLALPSIQAKEVSVGST
jgi:hypothetical protein